GSWGRRRCRRQSCPASWRCAEPVVPFARANGIDLYYELAGAGESLLVDGGHIFFMQDPAAMPTILDFLGAAPDPV
ncbi:MAG TPA: hypothetical protein VNV83_14505, partial [Acidimicrobiales bacterium]|nr:hypothetical protein [Acidimicrobiales bacterium]